ncbi:RHS repeat-associated core domain-containing protein [Sulfobacillus harzensis]|uniref:RHS repeat-associated core domain-containing protein n=1 Tax=Sulfobacillus harzensis TaxID=2729629 RepID=A0A7Y0L1J6_9FIRM|nr:RHS repeat-associated core domain-containing protein [Sulfobacillus harzensis]NMP21578.1 RHS repeat-associated core domain-containing protein [Sulfobacillus harzensis]
MTLTLNRLAQATQTNASGTVLNSYSWTYDANGNMLSKTANGTITNLSYNAANEMTQNGSYTYTYDANGNLTGSSAGLSLSYNAANQTTSITPAGGSADPMTYSGVGQANRLTEGSNAYQTDVTGISAMTNSSGTDYFTRTPSGQLISDRTPSGTYYYLLDAQGSVVGLTNGSGTLVDSYTYEPYGGIQSQTQNVAQPFKWIGAVYDSATGLYHIGARYYDPNFDRWTQMDPSGYASVNPMNPQTLDLYTYAADNPINYVDSTGYFWHGSHLRVNWVTWYGASVSFHLSARDASFVDNMGWIGSGVLGTVVAEAAGLSASMAAVIGGVLAAFVIAYYWAGENPNGSLDVTITDLGPFVIVHNSHVGNLYFYPPLL